VITKRCSTACCHPDTDLHLWLRTDGAGWEPLRQFVSPACRSTRPAARSCHELVGHRSVLVVVGFLGVVFWNVLRADPNSGPALDGVGVLGPGEEEPTFLPTPVISDAEEFAAEPGAPCALITAAPPMIGVTPNRKGSRIDGGVRMLQTS
jgi:hypothetical protein